MSFWDKEVDKYSQWAINFDRDVVDNVWIEIKRGEHLVGFDIAETKVRNLLSLLQSIEREAEFYISQCENTAKHYEELQMDLQRSPEKFSSARAQEIQSKSPQVLYGYAESLTMGCRTISDARSKIYDILKKIDTAKLYAETSHSKQVLRKIDHAIELMEEYLKVEF